MTPDPDFDDIARWEQRCVDTAEDRLTAEAARLRSLGILDEENKPTSQELPADMHPESAADLTAL